MPRAEPDGGRYRQTVDKSKVSQAYRCAGDASTGLSGVEFGPFRAAAEDELQDGRPWEDAALPLVNQRGGVVRVCLFCHTFML